MIDHLLNNKQTAKLLGIAPQTLNSMRVRGSTLRYVKIGRRCLYDPADIADWIASNKRTSTSETVGTR